MRGPDEGCRLVVNADDLGYAASVNAGIGAAHAHGIVTAATWLAGGAAAEAAVELARAHPALDVGLHLALSEVRPLGAPRLVAPLSDGDRLVPDYRAVWRRVRRGGAALMAAAEAEWNAQYDAFERAFGHAPSHVDSHQHVALFPALQPLFIRLAVARGVRWVRAPQELARVRDMGTYAGAKRLLPALVLSGLSVRLARRARTAGLRVPGAFAGFRVSGTATEADLRALAARLRPGVTEWMVHPGTDDTPDGCRRAQELAALTSPHLRADLAARGVQLSAFKAL